MDLAARVRERAAPGVYCVFDLDKTLWHGDCQPFSTPDSLPLYPEVKDICAALAQCSIPWAVASANPNKRRCLWLLEAHGLIATGQSVPAEIFPGGKKPHLERVRRELRRPAASMLFFDDLPWNCKEADKLGGVGVQVDSGLTVEALLRGLAKQREHKQAVHGAQASMKRWLDGGAAAQQQPRAKRAVSHSAAFATLRAVVGGRCTDEALEALLARHDGDAVARRRRQLGRDELHVGGAGADDDQLGGRDDKARGERGQKLPHAQDRVDCKSRYHSPALNPYGPHKLL